MSNWDNFPQLQSVLERGRDAGLHRGAQVYVSRGGEPLIDAAWGEQDEADPLTNRHVMLWMSAGKPLTAVALGILHDRGLLEWDNAISNWLPEWNTAGQPEVTLSHLLTHTAGFENAETGWPESTWEQIISTILERPVSPARPNGQEAGYVLGASWFLLGEVVARITQQKFSAALRDLVLEPLGLRETFCGLSEPAYDTVQEKLGTMYERTAQGLKELPWNERLYVTNASPGGNTRGPIRDLGRLYESMLPGGSEPGLLAPETRRWMTSRRRAGLYDRTFRHQIDWGLGFIVNSNRYGSETVPYGFGEFASEESFGHGGSQCSMGFADPVRELVVAWVVNGRPGEPKHQARNRSLNEAIYRDLNLAEP